MPDRVRRATVPTSKEPSERIMGEQASRLEAIIFDVDGTLAETERFGHRPAYNEAFSELGAAWSWSERDYDTLLRVEGGQERLEHYLDAWQPGFLPDTEDRDAFVDAAYARKNERYHERLHGGAVPLRAGVRRLIGEARSAGLRLAIASSSQRANVSALLTSTLGRDAETWFDAIATGNDTAQKKPAPEIYLRVLERLDLPPAACVAIEDSENGCRSAVAAGVPTLVTISSYTADHDFTGAALVADSLGEPGAPWRIRAGGHPGTDYLDLSTLRRIHARALDHPVCSSN